MFAQARDDAKHPAKQLNKVVALQETFKNSCLDVGEGDAKVALLKKKKRQCLCKTNQPAGAVLANRNKLGEEKQGAQAGRSGHGQGTLARGVLAAQLHCKQRKLCTGIM